MPESSQDRFCFFGRKNTLHGNKMVASDLHFQCWMDLDILIPVGLLSIHRDHQALFGAWIKVKQVEGCLSHTACFTPFVRQK